MVKTIRTLVKRLCEHQNKIDQDSVTTVEKLRTFTFDTTDHLWTQTDRDVLHYHMPSHRQVQ